MKHLAILMSVLLAAPAVADEPWEKPFAMRDAHGVHMGRMFTDSGGVPGVQMRIGQQRYFVSIVQADQDDGLPSPTALDYPFTYIEFSGLDCTGTAYTSDYSAAGMPVAVASAYSTGTVLLYPRRTRVVLVATQSVRQPDGRCQNGQSGQQLKVPLDDPIDITALFARPFSVK